MGELSSKRKLIITTSPFFLYDLQNILKDDVNYLKNFYDIFLILDSKLKKDLLIKIIGFSGLNINQIQFLNPESSFSIDLKKYESGYLSNNSLKFLGLLYNQIDKFNIFIEHDPLELLYKKVLPFSLISFLGEKSLYFCDRIHSYLNDKRYYHSISVAKTAYLIAENNSLDNIKNDCFIAGLFHDISKDLESKLQFEIGFRFDENIKEVEPFAYHQFASCQLAKNQFDLTNKEILGAIACHCTGKQNMTPLDMILYTADKVEPLRDFPTEQLRKTAYSSFNNGFVSVLLDQINYFKKHNISYTGNRFTNEMYNEYIVNEKEK